MLFQERFQTPDMLQRTTPTKANSSISRHSMADNTQQKIAELMASNALAQDKRVSEIREQYVADGL